MLNKYKVSIITPTFNSSNFIEATIISILNQSHTNWELIICDDNSNDDTVSIIKKYLKKDDRIKLIISKENLGAGISRNKSIEIASGRFIAFCDSDDQWKKNKLEKQINFMIRNNLPFTYSGYDIINEKGILKKTLIPPMKITYGKMLNNNYVGCLTAIYDSEKLGKQYFSSIRRRQDWVLWLRILKKINITYGIQDSLAIYRERSNSLSGNKIKMVKYNWKVYHGELGYSIIISFILISKFLLFYVRKKIF